MGARLTNTFDRGRFEVRSFGNGWAYEVHEYGDEGETVGVFWVQDADADRLAADCEDFNHGELCELVLADYMEALGE